MRPARDGHRQRFVESETGACVFATGKEKGSRGSTRIRADQFIPIRAHPRQPAADSAVRRRGALLYLFGGGLFPGFARLPPPVDFGYVLFVCCAAEFSAPVILHFDRYDILTTKSIIMP